MSELTTIRVREKWVDDVKVIACILVVLGHFFQSMTKAQIFSAGNLYQWFNTTIYYFHVQLFFICSGYLYQKYSNINSGRSWIKNIVKKAVALGIPYFTFSLATWILKTVFSSNVNDEVSGLYDTLFFHPTAPYWYLYALFFIFLVTPTFGNKKMASVGLCIALVAKMLILIWGGLQAYAVQTVLSNEIWFVLGMSISVYHVQLKGKQSLGVILGILFLILSIIVFRIDVQSAMLSFLLGLMACAAVIFLVMAFGEKSGKVMMFLAKYTMPIFLMHTLFAAPLRSVLLKVGITNAFVHVLLGITISFVGPMISAWIMKKTKWLEIFLYPLKIIKV